MTLINIVSGAIYLKNAPLKEKIQLYALALIFLFILYDSPSGLVCYWILNNTFSLFKNLVNAKVKNPRALVHKVISLIFLAAGIFLLFKPQYHIIKRLSVFAFALFVTAVPYAMRFIKKYCKTNVIPQKESFSPHSFAIFIFSAIGLSLLTGFVLPSGIISTSPIEFSFVGETDSPLSYIWESFSFFLGLCFFWPFVIYKLFGAKMQKILSPLWAICFTLALLNVYIFKYNYGNFSIFFQLETAKCLKDYSPFFTILPLIALAGIIGIAFFIKRFSFQKYASLILLVLCIAELGLGINKTAKIKNEFARYAEKHEQNKSFAKNTSEFEPVYHLSKDKPNVVILFLDRAISSFLPYIVKEFPEMEEQFSGFVYYPNTISFADNTAKGSPSMMAGYEYTPENENKRGNELLREKHNEASLVLPKLFLDAGFDVTITDPPFPNYTWKGDLSPFEEYAEIHASEIHGKYTAHYESEHPDIFLENPDLLIKQNIQSFILLEVIPPVFRKTYYCGGEYYRGQKYPNISFLNQWTSLYYLPEITSFDNEKSSYIFIDNESTHEPTLLENHTYLPKLNVDANKNNISCGFYEYVIGPNGEMESDAEHYHVNASTLLQVARWFDFLKANDCYDNTRIIIVADHGRHIHTPAFKNMKYGLEYAGYNPLFMVKDFNAKGKLKTDNSFMTNADTLFFAKKDLPVSDKNPFTGNKFEDFIDKTSEKIYPVLNISGFNEWNTDYLKDTKLWVLQDEKYHTPSYIVHDNIFDEANWERIVK